MREKKLIVIAGPTASGKTALGIALAGRVNGEIVSADSMQIYRGMDVGTAKATAEERAAAKHHMLDLIEPGENYSVSRYVEDATQVCEDLFRRGKQPIVVGGTGLYIDALLAGRQFAGAPEENADTRKALSEEYDSLGGAEMLERLRAVDPERAAKLAPTDRRRIIRALEVWELTGIPLSEHARRSRAVPPPWEILRIGIGFEDREKQYARIRERVDQMVRQGLLAEVSEEYHSGRRRATAAMAIGYKELLPWLRGEEEPAAGIDRIKQETCRFAKRQGTWFRRNADIKWIMRDSVCANCGIFNSAAFAISKWGGL